ncbi:FAD:protein FMN transferase [Puia dinghuensis]|uniref:FAD:protein FMN transferase n=1 Tax=Puia dinghuensis TaxID=1792502 RepID=A0A8J2UHE6_9BACT|nr:FAD:protein FMN transferase [Puia dinghuensis]GGB18329.1 FAD:protein FMN transferase [Puia dinghuensis]
MIQQHVNTRLMGSDFELIVVEKDYASSLLQLQQGVEEIRRIEHLLTEFSDDSQTALLNRYAGTQAQTVGTEVYQLINRSLHLSALTQGAFDISSATLRSLYNFKERGKELPSPERLAAAMQSMGYQYIQLLPEHQVFLSRPGMRIGFGAIGKGYAADKVKALWKAGGVTAGVINASGDLTAWGCKPDGHPWKIGIRDPHDPDAYLLWLPVDNASVATSGNYEQYVQIDGVRYSHNIDPRTGHPVRGVQSVTIISPSAELSDALATAVTVMGIEAGIHLVDQLPDTHAILIDDNNEIFTSKKINFHVAS